MAAPRRTEQPDRSDLCAGTVCLQGGGEFSPECLPMDAAVLAAVGDGPVVVLASAARPGSDYAGAGANGARHYREAGAREVSVAPDPRDDVAGALRALADARVVVLPGGSPSSLHSALVGTAVGAAVLAVLADGGAVTGSSAGAMLLCATTVLPEGGPRAAAGLGAVPSALVLAHWDGPRPSWQALAPAGHVVLGLPEASGLLLRPPAPGAATLTVTGVGVSASSAQRDGRTTLVEVGAEREI